MENDYIGAVIYFRKAIKIFPDDGDLYIQLAEALSKNGGDSEAQILLKSFLSKTPEFWQAHFKLGEMAETNGNMQQAVVCYRVALQVLPRYTDTHAWPEVHWRLGQALLTLGRNEEALKIFQEFVAISSSYPDAYGQIGAILSSLGRSEEAVESFERVLDMTRNSHPQAAANLAYANVQLKRWEKARSYFDLACRLNCEDYQLRLSRAFTSLLTGNFEQGWGQLEEVLPLIEDPSHQGDAQYLRKRFGIGKYWHGTSLLGKTLIVWTEHGLGDAIMMARYLELIPERFGAGEIIILAYPPLVPLLSEMKVGQVFELKGKESAEGISFDFHCSIMSLPYIFGTRCLADIPSQIPYFSVPPEKIIYWAERLQSCLGLKVGLVWAGNPNNGKDRLRSIEFNSLLPLFNIPGIDWVCLQKGERAAQSQMLGLRMIDYMEDCRDMLDSGALILNLDLVISVDTSVVHLAAALGCPTWLLNRHESEWRWLLDRQDSPWYPGLRIFHQSTPSDWTTAITEVAEALSALVLGSSVGQTIESIALTEGVEQLSVN